MSNTKALTQLGFVTARGLDNGELGALLLSNKVGHPQFMQNLFSTRNPKTLKNIATVPVLLYIAL